MNNIYRTLQERLDLYSFGFPRSESGEDILLLKKLFSEEEAGIFLMLTPRLETAEEIIKRTGVASPGLADKLEDMALRGLLFRLNRNGIRRYGAIPFMHGLVEFRINNLDKELSGMLDNYFEKTFNRNIAENASLFLRVVPINRDVVFEHHVAAFDDASHILKNSGIIAVADCTCRKKAGITETSCGKPLETCFMFGSMAEYYIENGIGRRVEYDEAVSILRRAQEAGLVTQPSTSQNPAGMCSCCGDCCGVLGAIKKFPAPAELVFSNYQSSVDDSLCISCGACVEICPMEAITLSAAGPAVVDLKRCIGCGLCSMKCPSDAIRLAQKAEDKKRSVPADTREQMTLMAKQRGLIK
ncbi:MAG TPA: 4Fe-4S binding protein [Spirochaetota bacterium]|nr:4Fe-4S binding protein [Spirochaetota bacterium]